MLFKPKRNRHLTFFWFDCVTIMFIFQQGQIVVHNGITGFERQKDSATASSLGLNFT